MTIPILQIRKLRPREVKKLTKDTPPHTHTHFSWPVGTRQCGSRLQGPDSYVKKKFFNIIVIYALGNNFRNYNKGKTKHHL